jgi:type I restriction enzyme S subunit
MLKERRMNNNSGNQNGWIVTTLGEVAKTNLRSIGKGYKFTEILYLDTGSITEGKIDSLQKLSLNEAPSRAKRLVLNQDVVYSTVRPNQKHFGYIENPDENMVVSTGFTVISAINDKSDGKFLYYFMTQDCITNGLQQIAEHSTSTYPSIRPEHIENLQCLIPQLPEQKAIAAVLTSFDDKIELLRQQNQTLEEMAQTLFKEWFVDYRFPGVGKMVDSETGMIPEEWKVGKLEELIEIKYGKDHKHLENGDIPVYGSGGIMRYANKSLYAEQSILIPRKGTLSNLFYINTPFWTVDTMFYSKIRKKEFGKFCFLLLKTLNLASMDVGSAVPSLTTHLLNCIKITIPDDKIIKTFDDVVSTIFKKKEFNETQIQTLTQLRDRLLPKLMSGEVRVRNFNKTKDENLN